MMIISSVLIQESCGSTERPFVIKVSTGNVGITANNKFLLPVFGANFSVKTDNEVFLNCNGPVTLTWENSGIYDISVFGEYSYVRFENGGDCKKLNEVSQWGSNVWETMNSAFFGCVNMNITATDAPDLSNCSAADDFFRAFQSCTSLNADINHWDMSRATSLKQMFAFCPNFNSPLNLWDVSGVNSLYYLFRGCSRFNQDINSWDTRKVTNMYALFYGASVFNKSLSNWRVDKVTTMAHMFRDSSFNNDIAGWNVSLVSDFKDFFKGAGLNSIYYDSLLNAWSKLLLVKNLSVDFGSSQYTGVSLGARSAIISDFNWVILDGGLRLKK